MTERTKQFCLAAYAAITTTCVITGAGLVDRGHEVPPWLTGLAGAALGNFTTLVTLLVAKNGTSAPGGNPAQVPIVWQDSKIFPPPPGSGPPPKTP